MSKIRDSLRARATIAASERGYYVDENGDVISPRGTKRKPQGYKHKGKNGGIYYRFTFHMIDRDGIKKQTTVTYHQLAAYQKFGEQALYEGVIVRHLDGNSENNRPSNIGIGDHSDNTMDQDRETRVARARHAARSQRKLNDIQVACIRKEREQGATLKQICQKYGIAKSTASYIVNRKTY